MPGHDHLESGRIDDMVFAITSFQIAEPTRLDGVDGAFQIPPRPDALKDAHGVYAIWAEYTDCGAKDLPCLTVRTPTLYLEAPPVVWEVTDDVSQIPANAARIEGDSGARGDDTIGWIDDVDTSLCWTLQFDAPSDGSVHVEQASISRDAGAGYQIVAGGALLAGSVEATGGWDRFTEVRLGTISIDAAGAHELRLRGASIAKKYLGTFRRLVLRREKPDDE